MLKKITSHLCRSLLLITLWWILAVTTCLYTLSLSVLHGTNSTAMLTSRNDYVKILDLFLLFLCFCRFFFYFFYLFLILLKQLSCVCLASVAVAVRQYNVHTPLAWMLKSIFWTGNTVFSSCSRQTGLRRGRWVTVKLSFKVNLTLPWLFTVPTTQCIMGISDLWWF